MDQWNCPDCPKVVDTKDEVLRRMAVNSHLKSHGKQPVAAPYRGGTSGRKPSGRSRGGGIGGAIGDFFDGLLD